MKTREFIPLVFDKLFTSIFSKEENKDILEVLLEDALELKRGTLEDKIVLKNRNLPTLNKSNAKKQVDLVVEVEGDIINVEVNNNYSKGIEKRNMVYLGANHGRQLSVEIDNYNDIKDTIQINFNVNKRNLRYVIEPYYYVNYKNLDYMIDYKKYMSIIMIDLKMGKEKNLNAIDKWCTLMLSYSHQEFIKNLEGIEMEKKKKERLKEEVERYNDDDDVVALYCKYTREEMERRTFMADYREYQKLLKEDQKLLKEDQKILKEDQKMLKEDKKLLKEERNKLHKDQKKLQQEKNKLQKEKITTAKKLLDLGMSLDIIVEATGLSKEVIETLK